MDQWERIRKEEARERYERKRLSDIAWNMLTSKRMESATNAQLEAAAKLQNQPGELGAVGRRAAYILSCRSK